MSEIRGERGAAWERMIVVIRAVIAVSLLGSSVTIVAGQNPTPAVISSGGTVAAQSATNRVSGSVGQVASSRAQSASHRLAEGFWNTVGSCDCPFIGDLNTDSLIDVFDVVGMVNVAFRNGEIPPSDPLCPLVSRADLNCDTTVDILDIVVIVSAAFRNNDTRCNPCLQ